MGNILRSITPRRECADDDRFGGPTRLDRARRLHSTHQRGPNRRCGLCLQPWPCAERSWAERTLRDATRPAETPRWTPFRWSSPLWGFYRASESSR
jgi:hypothetical protein